MNRFFVCALIATLSLIAPESRGTSPVPTGFLEGNLKVAGSRGADLADGNQSRPPSINYAEYPLVVLSRDGREEILRITADENGHYRVPLPPGDYILSLNARSLKRMQRPQRPFTVVSQQTVQVDLEIITGLSISEAPR